MDALNKTSKEGADETPKARFRTRDISIRKIYPNEGNFYSVTGVEELAQKILTSGLLENLTVMYEPCEKGEYKIIAGEKRWRALKLLVEKGHEEFEIVTCQIKKPASSQEEKIQLIIANSYRDKTVLDILEEERQMKECLTYMKDNNMTLGGRDLKDGRIRDIVADMLQTSSTKVAQIESINNRLIPEFMEQLKDGRLTFSAVYELSGMSAEGQKELLEKYKETGSLTWKDVKEAKETQKAAEAAAQVPGQMTYPDDHQDETEGQQEQEPEREEHKQQPGDDYQTPHPEGITSICYSCLNYSECNVKTGTCTKCDQYINKAEAEKTEEQRYEEEQAEIDRETARKLREMEQEEKMQHLPSDEKKKTIRLSCDAFTRIRSKEQTFLIVKSTEIRTGSLIIAMEFREGRATGEQMQLNVKYLEDSSTSSALADGYCVIGIEEA